MIHNMIFLLKKVQATKIKTGLFKRNAIYKKSNRERQRLYDLAYMWNLKNSDKTQAKLKPNKQKNSLITENRLVVARGHRRGRAWVKGIKSLRKKEMI